MYIVIIFLSLSPPLSPPSQVVCLARMMVYFGFYNFSKLLVLAKALLDGLDVKSATSPTNSMGGFFNTMGKHQVVFWYACTYVYVSQFTSYNIHLHGC